MPLFLVKIEYRKTAYQGETETYEVTRLVEAANKYEAADKAIRHYEDQSEPYGDCYDVRSCDVGETIT